MFLEKVFEAHVFRTACLKVSKSFIFYTQQTRKPLNMTPIAVFPCHGPLAAREYFLMFSQTPLERGQSPLYEHIRIISIGLIFFPDCYKM